MNRFIRNCSKSFAVCAGVLFSSSIAAHAGVYAHYPFDSGYNDSSGNARNGTLVEGLGIPTTTSGGASAGTVGNSTIITSFGDFKFGAGAMTLSTDRDYIALPQVTFSSTSAWSITF